MRPWLKYLLIRLGIFAVVLAGLLLLHVEQFVAAVAAAVAGFAIGYVFFRKLRDEVAKEFAARNEKPEVIKNVDTEAEDAALDRLEK